MTSLEQGLCGWRGGGTATGPLPDEDPGADSQEPAFQNRDKVPEAGTATFFQLPKPPLST